MNLKDARRLVRRLNSTELEHFAAIGMTFEFNMLEASVEAEQVDQLRRRPLLLNYRSPRLNLARKPNTP